MTAQCCPPVAFLRVKKPGIASLGFRRSNNDLPTGVSRVTSVSRPGRELDGQACLKRVVAIWPFPMYAVCPMMLKFSVFFLKDAGNLDFCAFKKKI